MDGLYVNLDVANKKGNFTQCKALGAYTQALVSVYNFLHAPDLTTLKAVVYLDNGTAISNCGVFAETGSSTGVYEATLELGTDTAIAYFFAQKPGFSQDLTLVVADDGQLYCNSKITVKNNPNAVPISPLPITTYFVAEAPVDGLFYIRHDAGWAETPDPDTLVVQSDEGFIYNLEGEAEQFAINDSMTAGEVRRGLITLVKYLQAKGVI